MTGPCSGTGVGVNKPGMGLTQFVGPGAIGGALAGLSGWAGAAVGAAVGVITYDLSTFCPAGPTVPSAWVNQDTIDLLNPENFIPYTAAVVKFRDFLGTVFWPILCTCTGGTSTVAAPIVYPSGGASALSNSALAGPCFDSAPFDHPSCANGCSIMGGLALSATPGLVPTAYVVRLVNSGTTGGGTTVTYTANAKHGSTVDATASLTLAPNASGVLTLPFNAALSTLTTLGSVWVSGTGNQSVSTQEQWYCGASPGVPATPCCPPDAATQAQLDAILQLVTLIQRQVVPFGYVAGTVHAGLTGAGSISIQGLIGVRVAITTDSAHLGVEGTSPAELFGRGYITFGTTDGALHSSRLERATQLILPCDAGIYTSVYYDLNPLITVSITELSREP